MKGAIGKTASFLGLERSVVGLLTMVILVGLGEKMAERFLPMYLLALGGGVLSVGMLNGLDNLLSALYSFPGGYLSDKLGTKKALFVFNMISMAGFVAVILIPVWQAVIAASFLFISWTAISLPATVGLLSRVLPKNKRTMGMSMHSLVRRIPMFAGPLIGGACISAYGLKSGVRIGFFVALVLAVIATFLQQKMIVDDKKECRNIEPVANPLRLFREMPAGLKRLLVSDILIRFCEQIPYAFVVVWCMQTIQNPVSAIQFGLLTTIEMVTAMVVYIPVAYMADRSEKKPFIVLTFVFFTLFPLALLFSHSIKMLALVFLLRGMKEFGEPTRKTLIMELAPENRKAAMFGLYYLIRDSIVSVAAFSGAFLWMINPAVNLLTAFGFGVLGTIWFAVWGKSQGEDC
jgi:MFS family permease